jgi:hypothetical protein
MPDSEAPITQGSLNRLEFNLDAKITQRCDALEKQITQRLLEHERRLTELNNAHDRAIEAKRLTDEAALRVQERTVTTKDLQAWKDEVNRALALQAGAAVQNAKTWALIMGVGVLITNILIRFLFPAR